MTFQDLELIEPLQKAIKLKGYTHPSPIQEQAIPILLNNQDLLGCAQTGTGKTAAFALPILQQLFLNKQQHNKYRKIKALIITPTRELAIQIGDSFTEYGKYTGLKNTVIFGGVKQLAQTQQLKNGIDILVATPGRLLDLMSQGYISLKDIEYFVLDEADHMLDMGFIHDIKKIVKKLPLQRQSLFFSATMPPEIIELSRAIVGNPQKITIKPEQATAEKVEQAVFFVEKANKSKLLLHLLENNEPQSTLVFSRTKHGADNVVNAAIEANVEKIILTSSIVAMFKKPNRTNPYTFGESDWTDTDWSGSNDYATSKTKAEQAAWELMESKGLKDKLTANAVRVPTPNGSLAILNLTLDKEITLAPVPV